MAAFYAEFRWSLPCDPATVALYADRISARAGYRCAWQAGALSSASTRLDATLSFPGLSEANLLTLTDDVCVLDFAPIPFFWIHSLRVLLEIGGTVQNARPPLRPDQDAPQWLELKWSERLKVRLGQGHRVHF